MAPEKSSMLVLGTVQFGLHYGVANKVGQPDQMAVTEIVRAAWDQGVREFDTAQDYGVSEEVLGVAFAQLGIATEAKVISKVNPDIDHNDLRAMTAALDGSLKKLGVPCLEGLMLHQEGLLSQWHEGLGDILKSFVASGKVKRIGVSVYSPGKALEALSLDGIDIIQVPSNLLDRRFEKHGIFELACQKKKQIYIRSVFLQGLILMNLEDIPSRISSVKPVLEKINALASEFGLTRQELALGYLKTRMPEAKLIIGVDTVQQVLVNTMAWRKDSPAILQTRVTETFDLVDEKILNPVLWG